MNSSKNKYNSKIILFFNLYSTSLDVAENWKFSTFFCGSCILFTGSIKYGIQQILVKIESHDIIYTFKNYFVIMFSVFSFP